MRQRFFFSLGLTKQKQSTGEMKDPKASSENYAGRKTLANHLSHIRAGQVIYAEHLRVRSTPHTSITSINESIEHG
jgi:hypothetical protein